MAIVLRRLAQAENDGGKKKLRERTQKRAMKLIPVPIDV